MQATPKPIPNDSNQQEPSTAPLPGAAGLPGAGALVSYPKSGRTWLRFMLNTYLCRVFGLETDNVFEAETKLAHRLKIENTHLLSAMIFKKPFWETGPIKISGSAGFKSVWLTRNARDTLRSAYYQATQRIKVFGGTPSAFLQDPRFGAVKIASFYAQMHAIQGQFPGLTIIRYEDCKQDPTQSLAQYITGLGLAPDPEAIAYAVDQGGMANMRSLSTRPAYANTPLAPTDVNDPNSYKTRGGNQQIFTDEELVYIDQVMAAVFPACTQNPVFANLLGDSSVA